jgi:uncharacterized membrane protein YagU involved in acid resistance
MEKMKKTVDLNASGDVGFGRMSQSLSRELLSGAAGGVAGGTAMTVLMTQVAPRVVPQSMLPSTPAPQRVVRWAERKTGRRDPLGPEQEKGAALAAHLGYSAMSGALYALVRRRSPLAALPAAPAGALFGLGVWAASFQSLLPALGVMPPTTAHPPKRWVAPLLGHSVFGVVTALVAGKVRDRLS